MLVLAIDSTMNGCSVGLYDDRIGALDSKSYEMTRGQAEYLMPMIDEIIQAQNISYKNIDCIAVTRGPGAFTGMRIGLSAAKALGLALSIPVIGVDTFQAVLQTYIKQKSENDASRYGVLLETKRKDFYFQMFDAQNCEAITEPLTAHANEVNSMINEPVTVIGDAQERFILDSENQNDYITHKSVMLPDPIAIACYAIDKKEKNSEADISVSPLYVRAPDVSLPKKPIRKLSTFQENDSRI